MKGDARSVKEKAIHSHSKTSIKALAPKCRGLMPLNKNGKMEQKENHMVCNRDNCIVSHNKLLFDTGAAAGHKNGNHKF